MNLFINSLIVTFLSLLMPHTEKKQQQITEKTEADKRETTERI